MSRFEDITWPLLKTALIGEGEKNVVADRGIPEERLKVQGYGFWDLGLRVSGFRVDGLGV